MGEGEGGEEKALSFFRFHRSPFPQERLILRLPACSRSPQYDLLLLLLFFFTQEGDGEDNRKKNKTKIKNNIFFHQEKFLDERSEYRFLNIYIYIYLKNGTPIFRLEISLDEKKYCFLFLFYFFFGYPRHPPPE